MTAEKRSTDFRFVPYLVGGFALLSCLLIASAVVAFSAIQSTQQNTSRLMEEQNLGTRLISDLQRDEDALSAILYTLMSRAKGVDSALLLRQLDDIRTQVTAATEAGLALGKQQSWLEVRRTAMLFTEDVRRTLASGGHPSSLLYRSHQQLMDALARLTAERYQHAATVQAHETERTRTRVRNMLGLLALALAVAIPGAIFALRSAVRIHRTLEWQTQELARLSARTMSVQEDTARRFSRELHDQFGQTLGAIEANLVAMRDAGLDSPRVADCLLLVKDGIANVRQISQLLRPSVLDDFGLDASLRWLAETFSQRTGVRVQYESTFSGRLSDDVETQLFRIAQEALTNIARHSEATRVRIDLATTASRLILRVADNGRGLASNKGTEGTGLIGMRARARETGGALSVKSARGQGVTIQVELPLESEREHAAEDPRFVGR